MRKGSLLVEQYTGQVDFEDFINNGEEIFEHVFTGEKSYYTLTDLSQCTFPNITEDQILLLMEMYARYPLITNGLKNALYIGGLNFPDFEKAFKFSEETSKLPISVITFNFLDMAFDWLGLFTAEKKVISTFLEES